VTVATTADVERRRSVAVALFGFWMMTGLFLDGWSHAHEKRETFFTPWHGVLYSGFGAAMLWFAWDRQRLRRAGADRPPPVGGILTAVGLGVFVVGALGDLGWHELFGVEHGNAALFSPTHLTVMTGGILMVSGPLRAAWATPGARATSWPEFWPVLASTMFAAALVPFFAMYLSPFRATQVEQPTTVGPAFGFLMGQAQVHAVAAVLFTSTLFMGALLLLLRRWRPPFGTFTVFFGGSAVAMAGIDSFEHLPLALCACVGGLVADVLVAGLRPDPARPGPLRVIGALVPVGLWLPYFLVFKLVYDLPWSIHIWSGTVVLAALGGVGLSVLAYPPELPGAE
jgi:hypothetical protein